MTAGTVAERSFGLWDGQVVTTVLVADGSRAFRGLVTRALNRDGGFEVVGETGDELDGSDVLGLARTRQPHVILLGAERLDALADLRRSCPKSQVVMLTDHAGGALCDAAIEGGARGVVRTGSSLDHVVRQVRALVGA